VWKHDDRRADNDQFLGQSLAARPSLQSHDQLDDDNASLLLS